MANEKELRERLDDIKRKLGVMEWDKNRNQFNPGKAGLFNELKEEQGKLEAELNSLSAAVDDVQKEADSEKEIVQEGLVRED